MLCVCQFRHTRTIPGTLATTGTTDAVRQRAMPLAGATIATEAETAVTESHAARRPALRSRPVRAAVGDRAGEGTMGIGRRNRYT